MAVSTSLGLWYHLVTGDVRQANYPSLRAERVEFRRRIAQLQHGVIAHQLCRPSWQRWLDAAVLAGALDARSAPGTLRPVQCIRLRDWVDPLNDIQAQALAIESGLLSRRKAVDATVYDIEEVDRETAADATRADGLGLARCGSTPPAGSMFNTVAIHNALKRHPAGVTVWIGGIAAWAASYVAMAGDEVTMPANTFLMIHDPSGMVSARGDLRAMAEALDKIKTSLVAGYAAKFGGSEADIAEPMRKETWFDAEEAVAYGFLDRVAERSGSPRGSISATSATRWSWSRSEHTKELATAGEDSEAVSEDDAAVDEAATGAAKPIRRNGRHIRRQRRSAPKRWRKPALSSTSARSSACRVWRAAFFPTRPRSRRSEPRCSPLAPKRAWSSTSITPGRAERLAQDLGAR